MNTTINLPAFHGMPRTDSLPQGDLYRMVQTPDHWFGYRKRDGVWIIPRAGDYTDGISTPKPLRCWIDRDAYWFGFIHDHLFHAHSYDVFAHGSDGLPDLRQFLGTVAVSKSFADATLYECGCAENVINHNGTHAQVLSCYLGVKWFGESAWEAGPKHWKDNNKGVAT